MLDYHMWVCLWHTIYNSSIYSTKKEGSDVKFYISFRSSFRGIEYIGVFLKYCFQSQCLHTNVVTGPCEGFPSGNTPSTTASQLLHVIVCKCEDGRRERIT